MKKRTISGLILGMISLLCYAQTPSMTFSAFETQHVRVQTPGLFDGVSKFVIHLDSIPTWDYCFPLPGGKVISPFGGKRRHAGTDIKTRANDTVRAVFSGVVRMAKPYSGYGNVVVVRHPNGLESVYSHNSKNLVKSGDKVKAGQPLGLAGRTGRATTEHVHFEFRMNGQAFNTNMIINYDNNTLQHGDIVCTKTGNGVTIKKE